MCIPMWCRKHKCTGVVTSNMVCRQFSHTRRVRWVLHGVCCTNVCMSSPLRPRLWVHHPRFFYRWTFWALSVLPHLQSGHKWHSFWKQQKKIEHHEDTYHFSIRWKVKSKNSLNIMRYKPLSSFALKFKSKKSLKSKWTRSWTRNTVISDDDDVISKRPCRTRP